MNLPPPMGDPERGPSTPWWLDGLGAAAAALIAGFGGVGLVLAAFGWFRLGPVLFLGAAASYSLYLVSSSESYAARRSRAGTAPAVFVLAVALVSVAGNAWLSSERVLMGTEAAALVNASRLVADQGEPALPGVVGGFEGSFMRFSGPGLEVGDDGQVRVDAPPYAAALFAAVGFAGDRALLAGPAIAGGIALLAFHVFAARVLRPWTSALLTLALAVNLAFVQASRDAFPDLAGLALVFVALAVLWDEHELVRPARGVFAGVLLGSATLIRPDWIVLAVPVSAWVGYEIHLAGREVLVARTSRERFATWFALGFVPLFALGTAVAVAERSSLLWWVVAALVAGLVARYAGWGRIPPPPRAVRVTLGTVVAVAIIAAGAVVAFARPARDVLAEEPSAAVAAAQAEDGVEVEPRRTYEELSAQWPAWYAGIPAAAAGLAGFALLAAWAVARGGQEGTRLAPFLVVAVMLTGWWVARPGMRGLHVDVMPRYLPVVAFLLVGAGWLVDRLWDPRDRMEDVAQVGAIALLGAAIGLAAWPTVQVWDGATQQGALESVLEVCADLGDDVAVVVAGGEDSALDEALPQAIRGFCRLPAAWTERAAVPELEALASAWDRFDVDVVLVSAGPDPLAPDPRAEPSRPLPPLLFESLEVRVEGVPGEVEGARVPLFATVVPPPGGSSG